LEAQIAAANQQLEEAQSKLQSAEQRLSAYEATETRIEELEAQLAAANRELEEAQSKLQSAEQRLSVEGASEARIRELEAQLAAANQQLEEAESKRRSAEQRLGAYQALLARIEGIGERFERIAAVSTREYSEGELLSLLETKLRLNEVLNSSEVQQEDPDLYEDVENYLRVYGRTFEEEGKAEVLRDVISLLQAVDREESTEQLLSIVAPYEEEQLQQLLQQFFTVLYDLVE
jgi:chromosome segregation ATPase